MQVTVLLSSQIFQVSRRTNRKKGTHAPFFFRKHGKEAIGLKLK